MAVKYGLTKEEQDELRASRARKTSESTRQTQRQNSRYDRATNRMRYGLSEAEQQYFSENRSAKRKAEILQTNQSASWRETAYTKARERTEASYEDFNSLVKDYLALFDENQKLRTDKADRDTISALLKRADAMYDDRASGTTRGLDTMITSLRGLQVAQSAVSGLISPSAWPAISKMEGRAQKTKAPGATAIPDLPGDRRKWASVAETSSAKPEMTVEKAGARINEIDARLKELNRSGRAYGVMQSGGVYTPEAEREVSSLLAEKKQLSQYIQQKSAESAMRHDSAYWSRKASHEQERLKEADAYRSGYGGVMQSGILPDSEKTQKSEDIRREYDQAREYYYYTKNAEDWNRMTPELREKALEAAALDINGVFDWREGDALSQSGLAPDQRAAQSRENRDRLAQLRQEITDAGFDADRIVDYANRLRNQQKMQETTGEMAKFASGSTVGAIAATAASYGSNLLSGIGSVGILAQRIFGSGSGMTDYRPVDYNAPSTAFSQVTSASRGAVSAQMGEAGQFFYGTLNSAVDSAARMLVGKAIGTGFLPNGAGQAAVDRVNRIVSGAVSAQMGTQVFTDAFLSAKQSGATDDDAILDALVQASIEGITEKYSVDSILKNPNMLTWTALRNSFIAEASEEISSDFLNTVYDELKNGSDSELRSAAQKYIDAGVGQKEAWKMVLGSYGKQVVLDGLAGGISGLAMGGTGYAFNVMSSQQAQNNLMLGLASPEGSTANTLARSIQAEISDISRRQQAGEAVSEEEYQSLRDKQSELASALKHLTGEEKQAAEAAVKDYRKQLRAVRQTASASAERTVSPTVVQTQTGVPTQSSAQTDAPVTTQPADTLAQFSEATRTAIETYRNNGKIGPYVNSVLKSKALQEELSLDFSAATGLTTNTARRTAVINRVAKLADDTYNKSNQPTEAASAAEVQAVQDAAQAAAEVKPGDTDAGILEDSVGTETVSFEEFREIYRAGDDSGVSDEDIRSAYEQYSTGTNDFSWDTRTIQFGENEMTFSDFRAIMRQTKGGSGMSDAELHALFQTALEQANSGENRFFKVQDKQDAANSAYTEKVLLKVNTTTSKPWWQQVDERKTSDPRSALYIRDTPDILRDIGLGDLPLCMTKKHLNDAMHEESDSHPEWHGVTEDIAKRLPELLAKPAMVLDSFTVPGDSVIVTTETDSKGRPIIAAIHPNGTAVVDGVEGPANFITSVYGRENFAPKSGQPSTNNFMYLALRNRAILYWNKERSETLRQALGVQFPSGLNKVRSDTIIRQYSGYVKNSTPQRLFKVAKEGDDGRQEEAQRSAEAGESAAVERTLGVLPGSGRQLSDVSEVDLRQHGVPPAESGGQAEARGEGRKISSGTGESLHGVVGGQNPEGQLVSGGVAVSPGYGAAQSAGTRSGQAEERQDAERGSARGSVRSRLSSLGGDGAAAPGRGQRRHLQLDGRVYEEQTDHAGRADTGRRNPGQSVLRAGDDSPARGRVYGRGNLRVSGNGVIDKNTRAKLNKKGVTNAELHSSVAPSAYAEALDASKAANPYGIMVDSQSVEDLGEMTLLMSENGGSGAAVEPDGNIVAVFNNPEISGKKGVVTDLILSAIQKGGNKLDCYVTYTVRDLAHKYTQVGMVPIGWTKFNDAYAPDGWDYEKLGRPDIVFWVHDGDKPFSIADQTGYYHTYTQEEIHALPEFVDDENQSGYEKAKARQAELEGKVHSTAAVPIKEIQTWNDAYDYVQKLKGSLTFDEPAMPWSESMTLLSGTRDNYEDKGTYELTPKGLSEFKDELRKFMSEAGHIAPEVWQTGKTHRVEIDGQQYDAIYAAESGSEALEAVQKKADRVGYTIHALRSGIEVEDDHGNSAKADGLTNPDGNIYLRESATTANHELLHGYMFADPELYFRVRDAVTNAGLSDTLSKLVDRAEDLWKYGTTGTAQRLYLYESEVFCEAYSGSTNLLGTDILKLTEIIQQEIAAWEAEWDATPRSGPIKYRKLNDFELIAGFDARGIDATDILDDYAAIEQDYYDDDYGPGDEDYTEEDFEAIEDEFYKVSEESISTEPGAKNEKTQLSDFVKQFNEQYGKDAAEAMFQNLQQLQRAKARAEARLTAAQESRQAERSLAEQRRRDNATAWIMYHKRTMRAQQQLNQEKLREAKAETKRAVAEATARVREIERAKAEIKLENQQLADQMYHKRTMRTQQQKYAEQLRETRAEAKRAVAEATAMTRDVERAKAEIKLENQQLAERMNAKRMAAKRLGVKDDLYAALKENVRENAQLRRNAAVNTLRDKSLSEKKRNAIETEQGLVDTIRRTPAERSFREKLQGAADGLRTAGRSFYRAFVSSTEALERFSKRQKGGTLASTLTTVAGASGTTVERLYKEGLISRSGDIIGDSMKDTFLCFDERGKKVDENKQALLQDYMLHAHNVDRMSFVANARQALEAAEAENPWLRDMEAKELARLTALTDNEAEKLGKTEARAAARAYDALLRQFSEAKDKPVFADANGDPVTAESSRAIVAKYEADNPWLREKAESIYAWWDKFMREWVVGVSITEADYAQMQQVYPHYVPTYRVGKGGLNSSGFVGMNGATPGQVVKKAKGSTSEIVNIEDSFASLAAKAIKTERLNELYKNIIDTLILDGGESGAFADMGFFDTDSLTRGAAYVTANGQTIPAFEAGSEFAERLDAAETAGLVKVGRDYKLSAWYDGELLSAYISEDLFHALQNVGGSTEGDFAKKAVRIGNMLTGPMKTAITGINPNFALRNISRDLPTAIINSDSGLKFPKYWAQAGLDMAAAGVLSSRQLSKVLAAVNVDTSKMQGNAARYATFQNLGGTHATYYNDNQGFTKAMSRGKNIFSRGVEMMGAFNEATEAMTRYAEYIATVTRRGDTYENRLLGIKNAAEVTVDFSRHGTAGKVINAWIPYWNPAVQGIDKVFRSVIESPDGSKLYKQAMRTFGRATVTTIVLEAVLQFVLAALDRRDDWEKLSDRTKDTYYCIPLPGEHKFLKVPKNREWGAILGTPIMRLFEYANGREDPFENYVETSLMPNFLPPLPFDVIGFSQAKDLWRNKDFAGRTIVPYAYQQGTKAGQYNDDTSLIARGLSDLLGNALGPMQIDYLIGDYFGDFGDIAVQLTAPATYGEGGVENVLTGLADTFVSPWVGDNRYSNQAVSDYYETIERLEDQYNDIKNHNSDPDAYKNSIEYQTYMAIEKLYGEGITDLNKYVRDLPDGAEKDEAKAQIVELAGEALQFCEDSMGGKYSNPQLAANYWDLPASVSDELIRLDGLSEDYSILPPDYNPTSYGDPDSKKDGKMTREYVLDDAAQVKYEEIRDGYYVERMASLIASSKYQRATDIEKCEMIEALKEDVTEDTKEEFLKWLKANYRSTPKK